RPALHITSTRVVTNARAGLRPARLPRVTARSGGLDGRLPGQPGCRGWLPGQVRSMGSRPPRQAQTSSSSTVTPSMEPGSRPSAADCPVRRARWVAARSARLPRVAARSGGLDGEPPAYAGSDVEQLDGHLGDGAWLEAFGGAHRALDRQRIAAGPAVREDRRP